MNTYKAMQVSQPGVLDLVTKEVPSPDPGQVLVKVEACGICAADSGTVEATAPGLVLPRVPGHEAAGRIAAVGAGVNGWRIGQRVGVGRLGGHCGECAQCRAGEFVLCENQPIVGVTQDGGYAEMMVARTSGLVSIPNELDSVDAAPLLCAGLATFNALRNSGARAGDMVAVLSIGGLGHLAVQYARKMGFKVVAIARGTEKGDQAKALGAHRYIDSAAEDPGKVLQAMGGAQLILTTTTHSPAVSALFAGLAPHGKLLVAGSGRDPISIPPGRLVAGERVVEGTITGSAIESEETLKFSVLADVRPKIEIMPLEHANDAYQRMKQGKAKFRMVLKMDRD